MTDAAERAVLEARIRALLEAGDKRGAAETLLEGYGNEVMGFLMTRLRDRDTANEAFSRFTEDLWRGMDAFRWECSARVWCYMLVRHAASHTVREARRHRGRLVPLSRAGPLSEIEERIRTRTLASARTANKSRIAMLRERLPPDDQALLILRVNRRLVWTEIALVMLHAGEPVEAAVLESEAARLRKRFQSVKERLRKMALDEGLAEGDD
jgi:RNA polymerase sigma-70 factor (ECF subfamily)